MTEESESTEAGRPSAGVDKAVVKEVLAELLQEFPAFKVALGGGTWWWQGSRRGANGTLEWPSCSE